MMESLRAIEQLVLDKDSYDFRQQLGQKFANLLYEGRWFTPLCQSVLVAAESLADLLSGKVIVSLYKGNVSVLQKQSQNSLYSEEFATFGEDGVYDQSHAEGFIRLYSLSERIRSLNSQQQSNVENISELKPNNKPPLMKEVV